MVQSLNSPGVFFGMGIGLFLLAGGLGWQFNRIKQRRKARRLQQQGLFADLQQANDRSEQLHTELAREVEQRRVVEARVRHLSQFDELTGLANRSLFKERLEEASQRVRQGSCNLTLLHINLDRFKLLNDNFGHELADHVLQKMAERITKALPEADTLARLSGDEFAVLFDAYNSLTSLARVATRLLEKLSRPLMVDGHELVISVSIGISLLPGSARDIASLVHQANKAMHQAKHLGGGTFQFYSHSLQRSTLERLQLENQLRKAIAERQLDVFYQPKLCLATGRLHAAEALVRWDHPQLGSVPPSDFIALAEETGLISAIGEFVLREACRQACEWQHEGLAPIRVSVNLSGHQLRQGKLVSLVRQVLEDTGLAPHCLELELTESQLLDNVEYIIATFEQLHALGVKLAIDDFGTGNSSLSWLEKLRPDVLKIDKSFTTALGTDAVNSTVTDIIIALGQRLHIELVAEGVETQEQARYLRHHGVQILQGFLYARPMPLRDFPKWLAESTPPPAQRNGQILPLLPLR